VIDLYRPELMLPKCTYQHIAEKLIKRFAGVLQGSWQSAWLLLCMSLVGSYFPAYSKL